MQTKNKISEIRQKDIGQLLINHFPSLMSAFYEMQSLFLSENYKRYKSIETANIILCLEKIVHLEILRLREKNLDRDISLNNFWDNFNNINKPTQKIVSIVKSTYIPKETVRRKIKNLISQNLVLFDKNTKEYYWNYLPKNRNNYEAIIHKEIEVLSKFTFLSADLLKLNLDKNIIMGEIKSHFSFYWYHFLNYQLQWLKMWQYKIKDIDLVLINLQAVIPILQYADKNQEETNEKKVGLNNLYLMSGKANNKYKSSNASVNAASVSEVTGIPRATCIRKLEILVKLGILVRESKTKRYFVNQSADNETKNIFTKENIQSSIKIFSEYLTIILNALSRNQK